MLEGEADRARAHLDRPNFTGSTGERIMVLKPLVTSGRLALSRRDSLLLQPMRELPISKPDDGSTALEMAG